MFLEEGQQGTDCGKISETFPVSMDSTKEEENLGYV